VKRLRATILAGAVVWLAACGGGPGGSPSGAAADPGAIGVVATTTVLADLVKQVGGSKVEVRSLVPPGGEVHTFDPSPSDVATVANADLVVMNGLGLDEWASDLVSGAGTDATVVELGEDLDGVEYLTGDEHAAGDDHGGEATDADGGDDHADEGVNPHLWLNVAHARRYVERIAEALAAEDPDDAATYRSQGAAYDETLAALDGAIRERMGAVPEENRRIVSFHEAFPYFADAYGLEIVGVIVEAPGQDPSAGEIAALVDAIRQSGAKAVFSEAQFDDRLARTIADEAGATVESDLYNDSIGPAPADSYVGMMEANVDRIEAALR
jgi:ABC-type Zn uptake system ZnuABC Zn-binding protein ZnuA